MTNEECLEILKYAQMFESPESFCIGATLRLTETLTFYIVEKYGWFGYHRGEKPTLRHFFNVSFYTFKKPLRLTHDDIREHVTNDPTLLRRVTLQQLIAYKDNGVFGRSKTSLERKS